MARQNNIPVIFFNRAFFTFDHIYFDSQYVSDNLLPQWALCSAAADLGSLDLNTK